jgi:hypothetical protein
MRDKEITRKIMDHMNAARHEIEQGMAKLEYEGTMSNHPEIQDLDFIHDQLNDYINELEGELYGVPAVEDWE